MKKILLFGLASVVIFVSCSKNNKDIFFKIGNDFEYGFSDIELYDTSSNIIYFKSEREEFKSIEKNTFSFLDDGDVIYSGSFMPGYSSSIPMGPFIFSPPSMFGNYALEIENFYPNKPDARKDPRIISLLEQHNLLHSGLAISSSNLEITGSDITINFTITNYDESDLLIIDPYKTGLNLFHYFTNGLYIRDSNNFIVFTSDYEVQTPDPWNSFDIDWLSLLKSGESRQFTIDYTIPNPLNPGEYTSTFEFPGLSYQVTLDQLYQNDSRIWLGQIKSNKKITIQ